MAVTCFFKGHDWDHCRCNRCGKTRDSHHDIDTCGEFCKVCGRYVDHEWKVIREENYGKMDYDSAGRPVNDFIVTLYKCSRCGQLKKEAQGDYCGDPAEYTAITDEERLKYGE